MNNKILLALALFVAMALAYIAFLTIGGESAKQNDWRITADTDLTDVGSVSDSVERSGQYALSSGPPSDAVAEILKAFDQSLPLTESFESLAVRGVWEYDDKVQNVLMWQFLCETNGVDRFPFLTSGAESNRLRERVAGLCEGFEAERQAMEDFLEVEAEERSQGVNSRAVLENSISEFGPDYATRAAIAEISRSLDAADYAGVILAVRFLGHYEAYGVSSSEAIYSNQPNYETNHAVAASIFCAHIGGCDGEHPIALNLCLMFPWLTCNRSPDSVYDAIDQILTGREIETFNEINQSLVTLLNSYRSGSL